MADPRKPVPPKAVKSRKNALIKTMKLEDFKPDQKALDEFCGKESLEQALKISPAK